MARDDWYRGASWNRADQDQFLEKLKRARGASSKAQYCRIKAVYLVGSRDKALILAGIHILEHLLENWPMETELALVYLLLAEANAALHKIPEAKEFFEKCLAQEAKRPNSRTQVNSDYPEFIVVNELKDSYDLARQLASKSIDTDGLTFVFQHFVFHGVMAIVHRERGEKLLAREHAQKAIDLTKQKYSGLRYHPEMGLVDTIRYAVLLKKIKAIAGARARPWMAVLAKLKKSP